MAEEGPMAQISLAASEGGRKGGGEEVRSTRTEAGRLLSRGMSRASGDVRPADVSAREFAAAPGPPEFVIMRVCMSNFRHPTANPSGYLDRRLLQSFYRLPRCPRPPPPPPNQRVALIARL